MTFLKRFFFLLLCCSMFACNSGDELADLVVDKPSRKPIDQSKLGVNDFFVNSEFGKISEQYSEIRDTLGVRYVRVLMAWTDAVQPARSATPDFSFFDNIIDRIPSGVDVLVVAAHTPSWMQDPTTWQDGNPRKTWVNLWLKKLVTRYASNNRIVGWEIWNEPDFTVVGSDSSLDLEDPANYFELLSLGAPVVRELDPNAKVLNAATRSIQQNYPHSLDYNRALRDFGALDLVDVWNVHYYGEQLENVVRDDGVRDFLNSLSKPIWITESGEQGPNEQLAYVETVWPYLSEKIPSIERIYYYEFGSTVSIEQNFGLRTTDPQFPVSDLYVYLRDN